MPLVFANVWPILVIKNKGLTSVFSKGNMLFGRPAGPSVPNCIFQGQKCHYGMRAARPRYRPFLGQIAGIKHSPFIHVLTAPVTLRFVTVIAPFTSMGRQAWGEVNGAGRGGPRGARRIDFFLCLTIPSPSFRI